MRLVVDGHALTGTGAGSMWWSLVQPRDHRLMGWKERKGGGRGTGKYDVSYVKKGRSSGGASDDG